MSSSSPAPLPRPTLSRFGLTLFKLGGWLCGLLLLGATVPSWAGGTFSPTGSLVSTTGRTQHTSTMLANGKVLVTGGMDNSYNVLSSAELFDPATGEWTGAGSLTPRYGHTATLLPNGTVLVVGGTYDGTTPLNVTELYDPATGGWTTLTTHLIGARFGHTASLVTISAGVFKVLVTGGMGSSGSYLATCELYSSTGLTTGTWASATGMASARAYHTATLLPTTGKVLVAGGRSTGGTYLATSALYTPSTNVWATVSSSMVTTRANHTATLVPTGATTFKVVVFGGYNGSYLSTYSLYDSATGAWTTTTTSVVDARAFHSASLLPNGNVLITGGYNGSYLNSSALCAPTNTTTPWTTTGPLGTARIYTTATVLASGQVLVAGGSGSSGAVNSAELFDSSINGGLWTQINGAPYRTGHTTTLLPTGKVLLAAGSFATMGDPGILSGSQLYDSVNGWVPTGALLTARHYHSATLLANGQVLVAGGQGYGPGGTSVDLGSSELYSSGAWAYTTGGATGGLNTPRFGHTSTLLANGQVLVSGGASSTLGLLSSSELYSGGTWTTTTYGLNTPRADHTATLLANGQVLVWGGVQNSSVYQYIGELYNPANGQWTGIGSQALGLYLAGHTATLLSSGQVLIAGGIGGSSPALLSSSALYDPATGALNATGPLNTARQNHTATLLRNGQVLVAGGTDLTGNALNSWELYDPATEQWTETSGSPFTASSAHTATLMPNGQVLLAGGVSAGNYISSQGFDAGLGFGTARQPVIGAAAPSSLGIGATLVLPGTVFTGLTEASGGGGSQNSASNYPLVQFRSLANEHGSFLLSSSATNWSPTSFTSAPVTSFSPGYGLLTVFTNGIPSTSTLLQITLNSPTLIAPTSVGLTTTSNALGGNVISDGGAAITAIGVVYSVTTTNGNPKLGGTGVTNVVGTGTTGVFTVNATGLTPGKAYSYAAYATNSQGTGYTSVGTFTPLVCPTITVTKPSVATGWSVAPFSQTFTETGGVGATTFSTTSTLPSGLWLSSAGVLSGAPTQTGSFSIIVKATDSHACVGTSGTYALVINACPTIAVTTPGGTSGATGATGTPFSKTFTESGGAAPVTFSTTSALPTGLSLSTTGVLSGTPTEGGSFPITATVTDSHGCAGTSATYTLVIPCTNITVTIPSVTNGWDGIAFSQTFGESGGVGATTFSTTDSLPTGLSLDPITGILAGIPSVTGSFPITVRATDSHACAAMGATYTLVVNPCPTITVINPTVTTATVYGGYDGYFSQSGGNGGALLTTTSPLPPGLTFYYGHLYGTPTQPGSYPITVTATDNNGCTGTGICTLVINCYTIVVTNPSVATASINAPFSQTFTQSGGPGGGSLAFSFTGTLPTGLSLNPGTTYVDGIPTLTGVLAGTPTQTGSFPITVTVTDSLTGCTGSSPYTLVVAGNNPGLANLTLSTLTLSPAFVDNGYGNYNILNYTASVPTGPTSMTVTPTAEDSSATIQVNLNGGAFSPVTSGTASGSLLVQNVGDTINVQVTSRDGTTTQTYVVVLRKNGFSTTADLNIPRVGHTANLLANGKVLVEGGLGTAEAYTLGTLGTWTNVAFGSTFYANTATTLAGGNQVLVAGAGQADLCSIAGPNIIVSFNPYPPNPRTYSAATLLPSGQVLVVGGIDNSSNTLSSSDLYTPVYNSAGTWTAASGTLNTARYGHTATLLPNGQVLVVGGRDNTAGTNLNTSEVYDPVYGTWTSAYLHHSFYGHTATLVTLPSGQVQVLVTGGAGSSNSSELYDPDTGLWTVTGSLNTGRGAHTATLLPNGMVLVMGGGNVGVAYGTQTVTGTLACAELYDPSSGEWTPVGSATTPRAGHTATLLANGQVLVTGGVMGGINPFDGDLGLLSSSELFDVSLVSP